MQVKFVVCVALVCVISVGSSRATHAARPMGIGFDVTNSVQEIAELAKTDTGEWKTLLDRIDKLVEHINRQLESDVDNRDELLAARARLAKIRAKLIRPQLTTTMQEIEVELPTPIIDDEIVSPEFVPGIGESVSPFGTETGGAIGGGSVGGGAAGGGAVGGGGSVGGGGGSVGGLVGLIGLAGLAVGVSSNDDPGPIASASR